MATVTTAPALETGTWQLDAVHSRVGFAVGYLAGTFHGSFAPFEAALVVDDDGRATLSGSAKVESIQVQDENLGAHLASPEFFDAEQAPVITFASDRFQPDGAFVAVPGELTIKGITKPVQLTGTISGPLATRTAASGSTSGWRRRSTARPSGSTGTFRSPAASPLSLRK